MHSYAGPIWSNGEATEGWIETDGKRVLGQGKGKAPTHARPAVVLDGLVNYHSHVGDAFLEGEDLPRDLAQLVAPETGFKSRRLARTHPSQIQEGIARALHRYASSGIVEVLDFREQGPDGIEMARQAQRGVSGLHLRLFGRPSAIPWGLNDIEGLLRDGDGIGIPSLKDYGKETCEQLRQLAQSYDRTFAMHASEVHREPIEDILGLDPDFLVHVCQASPRDLQQVVQKHVPVVVCPTSNAFFGIRPIVEKFEEVGIPWYLGTDNAMFGSFDLLQEVKQLRMIAPKIPDGSILRALTTRPWKAIKRVRQLSPDERIPKRMVVLPGDARRVRWDERPVILER